MKKMVSFVIIFVLLVFTVFAIFIATFDANRLRPHITRQLETLLGYPVRLGPLSLHWKPQLSLTAKNIEILSESSPQAIRLFSIEEMRASLKLSSFPKGDIQFLSLTLVSPKLEFVQQPDGSFYLQGFHPSGERVILPSMKGQHIQGKNKITKDAPNLFIDELKIENGEVSLMNNSLTFPWHTSFKDITVHAKNLSFFNPVEISMTGSFLSPTSNVRATFPLMLPTKHRLGSLNSFQIVFDLSSVDGSELMNHFPIFKSFPMGDKLSGLLQIEGKAALSFQPLFIQNPQIRFAFHETDFAFQKIKTPFRHSNTESMLEKNRFSISHLQTLIGYGLFHIKGAIEWGEGQRQIIFEGKIRSMNSKDLISDPSPDKPRLETQFSMTYEGSAHAMNRKEFKETLAMKGEIQSEILKISDFNFLHEVLSEIPIPNLVNTLLLNLPPDTAFHIKRPYTECLPFQFSYVLSHGRLSTGPLVLLSDSFILNGEAMAELDGTTTIKGVLSIERDISQGFFQVVEELRVLEDSEKRLQIPLQIQRNPSGDIRIFLDSKYLQERLKTARA